MTSVRHTSRNLVGLATLLALVGCADSPLTGPSTFQFSNEISIGELEETLASGATRLEIELQFGSLIAHEVTVEEPEALSAEEKIESLLIALDVVGESGTLTLFLGGLQVDFDAETRFSAGDDDLSLGVFVEEVQAILNEGSEPRVEVRREPPAVPQDPEDASFFASDIRLRDEVEPTIEMNVDERSLELNTDRQAGEADGWITVLGLRIELLVSEGVTDLNSEHEDFSDEVDFEGHVTSVDLEASTFTLGDGTIVRVVDGTHIRQGDDGHILGSLAAVHEALEADHDVVAWGDGVVEGEEPLTLIAIELTFVLASDDGGGDTGEFEGFVASVNLETSTATLTNGVVVRIVDATAFADGEGKLTSLEAVVEALEGDMDVVAYGHGEVESIEPLTITAIEVAFVLAAGQ